MGKFSIRLILAVLVIGGWYFASPWLAMNGIVDAARDGDLEALEQRVDFAQLREDTREEIAGTITGRTGEEGPLGRFGGTIAGEIAGVAVDNALTPQGLSNLVTIGTFASRFMPERFRGQELEWDIKRTGFESFKGVSTWADGTAGPVLMFERDGIGWKMTGFELPDF